MNRKFQRLAWLWLIACLLLGQSLDARRILPDRYAESITEVVGGKVVTTLSVTTDGGLREVLQTEWTPASGVTVTHINGNEESITTTPDYGALSLTSSSSKGWTRSTGINALGLASSVNLSGAAHPSTSLTPTWRSDGSLASVSLQRDGDTHTADFHPDGTLASLTAPGQGNILGGHSISGGVETLTVNGTTTVTSLDGTQKSTGGPNAIGQDESLTAFGGTYTRTVTPATGAATQTFYNTATVPTAKTYADDSGESYGYSGERLSSISLARGGALTLEYSDDGAKDLLAATWPELDSGPLTSPAITHGYSYNRSGDLSSLSDDSGTRSLSYQSGRHAGTSYTAGLLQGYAVLPQHDSLGRRTGTLLDRDGQTFHSTTRTPDGLSDRIAALSAGAITATPQRDGAGRISGYSWSDGSANSVTQSWTRGAGGRIEAAGSDVPGAPTFDYLIDPQNPQESFDSYGRRLKCETAGGIWTYEYGSWVYDENTTSWVFNSGAGGQLASATHPTLGSFTYQFDGIGRRIDEGTENTSDILNRTTAWTHDQNKTITIQADPNARVWFNGTEVTGFSGSHQETVAPPGPDGGWVPWNVLAVLEGAGDGAGDPPASPLASPDAKAEKKGAVWVPPAAETFTYDAAGNRQSSAQWDYGWNAKNQLARIRTKDHATAPQAYDISFSYDAEGRRVKKHVVEYADGSPVAEKTVTYVWDEWELLYERHQLPSGLTTLERKYLWGPDIADGRAGGAGGLLLIRETKGDTTTEIIPLYDGTGHVVALTDIEKNLLAEYAYGPFGEKIHATGPRANSNPWRYATKYLDAETGLYYFGHRYYDPVTGQWLSREPLGESESINLYVYAGNDPINHVDVQGLYKRALNVPTTDEIETLLSITRAAIEERKTELVEAQLEIAQAPRITSTITGRSHAADPSLRNRPGEIERQINKLTDQAAQLERALRISPLADASESFNSIPLHRALKREYGSVRDPEAMAFFAPEGGFLSGPELVAWERFIDGYFKEMTFATATMPFAVIGQARHLRHGGKVAGVNAGLPAGTTFESKVYRAVNPKYIDSAFGFHAPSNLGFNARYTGVGRGGIYSGTSKEAVLGELAHYGVAPSKVAWVSKNISVDNVLDLTNSSVRKQLGITLDQITGDSYKYTQGLGDLLRSRGYNGVLFPSARASGTSNFVEFINHAQ